MKKIVMIFCITALLVGAGFSTALASFQYQVTDTQITLSGTLAGAGAEEPVTALILKKGKTAQEVQALTAETASLVVQGIVQGSTTTGGAYELVLPIDESFEAGILQVFLNTPSFSEPKSYQLIYLSAAEVQLMMTRFNQSTASQMADFLTDYQEILGLDFTDYAEEDFIGKKQELWAYLAAQTLSVSDGVQGIVNAFTEGMLLQYLRHGKTGAQLSYGLTAYDPKGQFPRGDFDALKGAGFGNDVADYLSKADFSTLEKGLTAFSQGVFLTRTNQSTSKAQLQETFLAYNESLLQIPTGSGSKYASVNREDFYKELSTLLQRSKATSISDYKNKFQIALDQTAQSTVVKPGGSGGTGGSVTVYPEPEEPEKPVEPIAVFRDLGSVPWAKDAIMSLYEKQIITGDGNGNFRPNDWVTREEFIKMMVMAAGIHQPQASSSFSDVGKGEWYASYVGSAEAAGILQGMGDGTFGAGQKIQRQDLMTLLYRAAKELGLPLSEAQVSPSFTDEQEMASYAKEAVFSMAKAGIVSGFSDGTVKPKSFATRGETAKLLEGFLKQLEIH